MHPYKGGSLSDEARGRQSGPLIRICLFELELDVYLAWLITGVNSLTSNHFSFGPPLAQKKRGASASSEPSPKPSHATHTRFMSFLFIARSYLVQRQQVCQLSTKTSFSRSCDREEQINIRVSAFPKKTQKNTTPLSSTIDSSL